jgi:transposase, IS30 family
MKYKHLTPEQRYQISAYKQTGWTRTKIALKLGVHKSTIGRELKRNLSQRGYRPKKAEELAQKRRRGKGTSRISPATWETIENALRQQWSPDQISRRLAHEGKPTASHEWIYQHIYHDKRQGGTLHENLRCRRKRKKRYGTNSNRGVLVNQIRIDERPAVVAEKSRLGDWEVDSVIGKGHQQSIVTMVERKTKLLRMMKIDHKTGDLTRDAICLQLQNLVVQTITSDNGKEFSEHEDIAKTLKANFYFCHPYSSWERGVNENTNGLIRQYFPKHTAFATITEMDIKEAQEKLNHRPRKTLGYLTPHEVYFKELAKLTKVALTS